MELRTVGRTIYPGYELPIAHTPHETFAPDSGYCTHFRLILVEQGAGILQIGSRRETFIAPTLFCLNETESLCLEQTLDVQAQGVYLHPNAINSTLDFINIRTRPSSFSVTEQQDSSLLRAFIHRDESYSGHLHVDPASAKRLTDLFEAFGQELALQRDGYWPCRSRSYMLELLFVVDRLYDNKDQVGSNASTLPLSTTKLDPVILYLHSHYQDKITVQKLVKTFHTNRTTLNERFRESTGVPIMTYLARLRVRLATSMLHDTSLPIFEVAERVGFSDLTHFGRTFRKYTGCSPSEYRERYCWMLE